MLLSNFLKKVSNFLAPQKETETPSRAEKKKPKRGKTQEGKLKQKNKVEKEKIIHIDIENIDNYDNGYRGIFPHRVTELKVRERLDLEPKKIFSHEKLKPIYQKRDYTEEEQKMINDFLDKKEQEREEICAHEEYLSRCDQADIRRIIYLGLSGTSYKGEE